MILEIEARATTGEEKGQGLILRGEVTEEHANPIRDVWGTEDAKKAAVELADSLVANKLNPVQRLCGYTVEKVRVIRNRTTNAQPKSIDITVH